MNRNEAENTLKKLFQLNRFYDLQWDIIERLLNGKRILFIEKTGYGKSLCYQFTATQLEGVTIVFSPLIALMRDQVNSMNNKVARAATINSNQSKEENEEIINEAKLNKLDILYIAPERMENAEWIRDAREMNIAMIVIDEAHCISIWGQSFRPNYRRIVNLVKLLPKNFPVLATTATATKRVEIDVKEQIGEDIKTIRGRLLRPNINLFVKIVNSEDEKFYWLAEYFPKIPKTGIIYTGTRANTDIFSNWLQYLGFNSASYSGRLDGETRKRVEEDFLNNKLDCVVSTNALGMGIDKPDIRFIIHTQIPQSPIYYYQEIGRAGRDGQSAYAILLYNPERDTKLPQSFIDGSKPTEEEYRKVMSVAKKSLMGRNQIIKATNLKQTQVEVILADLIDQDILNEYQDGRSKKYFYNIDAPELDVSSFKTLRNAQEKELYDMIKYTEIKSCRMQYLCEYLGDNQREPCRICDNDRKKTLNLKNVELSKNKLKKFRESFFPELEVETKRSNIVNGVAASYYGVTNVGSTIHNSKYVSGNDFPDWILGLTLKAFRKRYGKEKFDLILYVPPTESGDLVKRFAEKISSILKIPMSHKLIKIASTSPQKVFQSGISKRDNVKNKFIYKNVDEIAGKKILLVDDIFDSGYTIKEIGKYLTSVNAKVIAPLVIAKTVGGDI